MAMKDINLFEKHAEKMVLGAAAAGAVFMGYLATQKITADGDVAPNEVQTSIQHKIFGDPAAGQSPENPAAGTLEASRRAIEKLGEPKVVVPDYVGILNRQAAGRPLDQSLLSAVVPPLGPNNYTPSRIDGGDKQDWALVPPDPVPVEMLHVEVRSYQVAINPLKPGAVLAGGMQLATDSKKVVVVEGFVPVGRMMQQMLSEKDPKAKIQDEQRRRVVIQAIHVQRSEIRPGGAQGPWTTVPPPVGIQPPPPIQWGALADGDFAITVNQLDQQFKEIVLPDYRQDALGIPIPPPITTVPLPEKAIKLNAELEASIAAARIGPGVAARGGPPPVVAGAGNLSNPIDALTAKGLQVIPFTVWDETVEAGHRYRYQVSVDYVNPLFGWKWGVARQGDNLKGVLASKEVTSEPVKVDSDIEFFVSASFGAAKADQVSVKLFKQFNGKWSKGEFTVQTGTHIAGKVTRTDETPVQYVNVDTKYTLVDVQPIGNSGESRVILRDADGNLSSRDTALDGHSPDLQRLMTESSIRAATTAPESQPGVVSVPPTPTPARSGPTTPPTRGPAGPTPPASRPTPILVNPPARRGN